MKITLSKFPNDKNETMWQVHIPGTPLCKETDEKTASAIARTLLHKYPKSELWFWDAYTQKETFMDRS